jgi:KRAB domain-containing zinc finger protein
MRENAAAAVAAAKATSKPITLISKPAVRNLKVSHISGPVQGYNCTVCKKWVKTQSVLRRHMTSHTKLKLFSCVICNISMGYASSLHKHMRLAHNVEMSYKDIHAMFSMPALEEQEALCMLEQVNTTSVEKNKIKPEGEKNEVIIVDDPDDDIDNTESVVKYGCTCSICFKTFSNKRLLENHMKIIHMGGRAYKCNTCSKLFAYKHLLVKHAKIHSGKDHDFSCSVCSRTFPDMKTLNNHKGVHTRSKYYTCPICSKSFNGLKNWEQHQKLHNSSVRFRCKLCGKTFLSKTDLYEHKKMHIKLKIYTCGVCKNSYNSTSTLNRHKRRKHGGASGMNPYAEDSEDDMDEEDQCFVCNICSKTFTDSVSLGKHKLIHMKRDFGNVEEMSDNSAVDKASSNTGSVNSLGKFPCLLCQRDFPDQSSLSKHKGWHSRTPLETEFTLPFKGKKVYVCGYCNRSFANSGSLSKHRKLNCPPKRNYIKNLVPTALIPGKSMFSVKQALNSVKTATQVKQTILPGKPKVSSFANASKTERARHFPCLMCEKIFSSKKALIRHKGWHTRCPTLGKEQPPTVDSPSENDKNVVEEQVVSKHRTCNVCFKVYSSASTLSRHKRLHTRKILTNIKSIKKPLPVISDSNEEAGHEGLHACQYCRKLFRFRKHLVDHERVHTGERPFSCNQCSLSFSRRAILWRHKKTHLGVRPYSCTLCPKSFLMNFQLNQHIAEKHMAEDIYACHRCNKTYRTMLALKKHEQLVHEAYVVT